MKRSALLVMFLFASLLLLAACAQAPTEAPATATLPPATATEVIPTPTATEVPVLPCDIAFDSDRDGNREVYVMNPDGTRQVNLSQNPADDFDPVWSPDGTHIAFVSNRETEEGGQYIYTMLADGSDVVQVSHQGDSQFPDWSPLGDQIVYQNEGDIYLIDLPSGSEVNLTNSPEKDGRPKISPDGQRIAWIKGEENDTHVYVMDIDGSNPAQVTAGGRANGVDWSVDGRIFTTWEQPDGICFNCLVTVDGTDIADAGGKGTIREFLPFWTVDGERVELGAGDIFNQGNEDVFIVSENIPDLFYFLTSSPGNDRDPDTAAMCGPTHGIYPQYGSDQPSTTDAGTSPLPGGSFTIGYTGAIDSLMQGDFDTACAELRIECVHGESVSALTEQGVDAIVNASSRWDVYGSGPAVHEAVAHGIPVFMLNAESDEPGVYNLSVEKEVAATSLTWMVKNLNGQGEIAIYNFGDSGYMQNIVEGILKGNPGITTLNFTPSYEGSNPFSDGEVQTLLTDHPNLGAIWSSEAQRDLFWLVQDDKLKNKPYFECEAKKEMLISWKNAMDAGNPLQCISFIRPGGTAYEGIYVAFFYLNGSRFRADAFAEGSSNTLRYDLAVLTNQNLPEWIGPKLEALRGGESELYTFPPMTPAEIKSTWFE